MIAFGDIENTLAGPPGHHDPDNIETDISCAGAKGCHGKRKSSDELVDIRGAHHKNEGGKLDTADQVYNSYRFLWNVKGFENNGTYKWQNEDADNHNEYFGAITPMTYGACSNCHDTEGKRPQNNTMSGFCSTCHGAFHFIGWQYSDPGIGDDTSSPFMRHPTDVILPNSGEYADYNGAGNPYSVAAPVARTTVPNSIDNKAYPGTDVVMCLSCHSAHATDYPDMLRWNYDNIQVGTTGAGAGTGCFTCHTGKDGL